MKIPIGILLIGVFGNFNERRAVLENPVRTDTAFVDTVQWNILQTQCRAVSRIITNTFADSSEWESLSLYYYTQHNGTWQLHQQYDTLESTFSGGALSLVDFNLDGTKDLQLFAGTDARGINENYYVFLSDTVKRELIPLNNCTTLTNPNVDTVTGIIETAGFAGATYLHRYRIENNALVNIAEKEIWVDDSTLYQRTIYHFPNGMVVETIDSSSTEPDVHIFDW